MVREAVTYWINYHLNVPPGLLTACRVLLICAVQLSLVCAASYSSIRLPSQSMADKYFRVKPADTQVVHGESVQLSCQLYANSDTSHVQWSKDGILLGFQPNDFGFERYETSMNETDQSYSLRIDNAQLEDEGVYECQASGTRLTLGAKHTIKTSAVLSVIVPPKQIIINSTRSPDDHQLHEFAANHSHCLLDCLNTTWSSYPNTFIVEAYENQKVTVVCSVFYSKPVTRIKWFRKNIELLSEAAKTTIRKTLVMEKHDLYAVESHLVLYPRTDEEYRCQAEHVGLAKPLRALASINIFRKPSAPVIEGYKSGEMVNYQEKLTLKCTSSNGYPAPSVTWLKNGVEMDGTFMHASRLETVNTLTLVVEQDDNQAEYMCQVMSKLLAAPLQTSVILNVLLLPTQIRISAPNQINLNELHGTLVSAECIAYPVSSLNNQTHIRWLIDGQPVSREMNHDSSVVQLMRHDQPSWTLRSNLTFVINSREPSTRSVVCIAYSGSLATEIVSATHRITVIYPPEMPTLLGVKNGMATVAAGKIFKCKCVVYSGNPSPHLVWLNHHNHEISAVSLPASGARVSSELVIRPGRHDNGNVYRCHVRHPALDQPYEVSFTLQVIFPPTQINITMAELIKENDTIKIECQTSQSNPCPGITLFKNGAKMDEIGHNRDHNGEYHQQHSSLHVPLMTFHAPSDNQRHSSSSSIKSSINSRAGSIQSAPVYGDDQAGLAYHNQTCASATFQLIARPEDDGSEIVCIANNSLSTNDVIRDDKILTIHYKPKLSESINVVELNENDSYHHTAKVYANPAADSLTLTRVHKPNQRNGFESSMAEDQEMLDDLMHNYHNHSWLLEPVPSHWSWSMASNVIVIDVANVSLADNGLYVVRVANSLGHSLMFIRLSVKRSSTIFSMQVYAPENGKENVEEGDTDLRVECKVLSNDSITLRWSRQSYYHSIESRTASIVGLASPLSSSRSSGLDTIIGGVSYEDVPADSIDWSRSNVSQLSSSINASAGENNNNKQKWTISRLTITNVSFEDAGLYVCSSSLNTSKNIQVKIAHAPRILMDGSARGRVACQLEAKCVKLVCSAIAHPRANFNWTVRGNRIAHGNGEHDKYGIVSHNNNNGGGIYFLESQLIIRRVTVDDFQAYSCTAYNPMGMDQMNFELVQKSFPESPRHFQVLNTSHNSAFLTWQPGFDYGHKQYFEIEVWQVRNNNSVENEQRCGQHHQHHEASERTVSNISANYFILSNLEPSSDYELCLTSYNLMGKSSESAYLSLLTLSQQNYLHKPVYASADEQRLNGIMGNRIIGDDFLELSVILCLLLLVLVSSIVSMFVYCQRKRQRQEQREQENQHQQQQQSCKNPSTSNESGKAKLMDSVTHESSLCSLPLVYANTKLDCSNLNTSTTTPAASCMVTQSRYFCDVVPCSKNKKKKTTTTSTAACRSNPHPSRVALSSSICQSINLTTPDTDYSPSGIDLYSAQYLPCLKDEKLIGSGYLTLSPPQSSINSNDQSSGTVLYPYELTSTSYVENANMQVCPTERDQYGNVHYLLSHQQITNIQLLPKSLEKPMTLQGGAELASESSATTPTTASLNLPTIQLDCPSELNNANRINVVLPFEYGQSLYDSLSSPSQVAKQLHRPHGHTAAGAFDEMATINQMFADSTHARHLRHVPHLHSQVDSSGPLANEFDMYELRPATSTTQASQSTQSLNNADVMKRVNLINAPSSLANATLTTLSEEDEI